MSRWHLTIGIASFAVLVAFVALWFAVTPQGKGGQPAPAAAATPDSGATPGPANGGATAMPQGVKPPCTGRYADSLEQISDRNREFEKNPESSYSYCLRNTATYEQVYYDSEGKLQKRHLTSTIHGTAFVYKAEHGEYFLLTNDHVASQPDTTDDTSHLDGIPFGAKKIAETLKLVKNEEDTFEKNHVVVTRVVTDPLLDAAILKTTHRLNASPYKIGMSSELKTGNAVMLKGFPLGIFTTSNIGRVTNFRIEDSDGAWQHSDFVIDAQLNTGQSGSPVMAVNCQTGEYEIVGLFHAYYSAGKGLNLAVHIDDINDLIATLKARKPERKGPAGFVAADDQLKIVRYLLDRKNLSIFRYGSFLASAEVEKDRTVRVHVYTDAFPSNPLPRVTFVDHFHRAYGELDQVILTRLSGKQVARRPADISEEARRRFQKLYTDLWQQLLKTIAYRDLLAYSQESEELYKRTAARLGEIENARKSQTEQVENVFLDADKIVGQEESR